MQRILVIDDDAQARDVLQKILQQAGYEVVVASNGGEAMQRYRTLPAELVITDIFMPEQEGLETIQQLRRLSPTVKIIAISGGGRNAWALDFLSTATRLGAQDTLRKPLRQQELLTAVRRLMPEV